MSHFTVAVITKDGDYARALAPFDENLSVEKYIRRTREDIIKQCKEQREQYENTNDEKYKSWYETSSWSKLDYSNDDNLIKSYLIEFEDDCYDEEGNEWSTYNPNSKWDWYSVGGRWVGSLRLKYSIEQKVKSEPSIMSLLENTKEVIDNLIDENRTDHAQIKDIDFTPDLKKVEHYKRYWEVVVEDSPLREGEKEEDFRSFYNKKYYLEKYKYKETYIKQQTSFHTYALLYNGEWIEPNSMGWFGFSNATKDEYEEYRERFEEIISNLDENDWLTVVDCHI